MNTFDQIPAEIRREAGRAYRSEQERKTRRYGAANIQTEREPLVFAERIIVEPPGVYAPPGEPANEDAPEPLSAVKLSSWFGKTPPKRKWFVPDWIPMEGEVFGLYGDGGIGKSFLALIMQTVSALEQPWFGHPIEPVRSLGIFCEDSETELWRRYDRIAHRIIHDADVPEDYAREALSKVNVVSRLGQDNLLMTFSKNGKGELTRFHKQVLEMARDEKCKLVILDNAATMFAGNQIEASQVRQFVDVACGSISMAIDGAVGLCAHPSANGMNSGSGTSGSVQWNAAFRSRLYISHPTTGSGEKREVDKKSVIISRMKGNYADAESSDQIRLRWDRGMLVLDRDFDPKHRPSAETVFMMLLDARNAQGRYVTDNSCSWKTYAPAVFAKEMKADACGYSKDQFEGAMNALFKSGSIKLATVKKDSKDRSVIARDGWAADGEH